MELLGRIAAVVGISLALTALLIVLYQDEGKPTQPGLAMTQAASATVGQ